MKNVRYKIRRNPVYQWKSYDEDYYPVDEFKSKFLCSGDGKNEIA
jgi:hypothetical protein